MRVPDPAGRGRGGRITHQSAALGTDDIHRGEQWGAAEEGGGERLRKIEPDCECTLTCSIQSSVPACTQPSRQR